MTARFTALASGSAGNACLIEDNGCGVLVDFGLGPRTLAGRMAARGLSWRNVDFVLLTHTHSDHWRETTLVHLSRLSIRLGCHAGHAELLSSQSDGFNALYAAGLVDCYSTDRAIDLGPGLTGLPLPVEHDAGETFGFRFEGGRGLFGPSWALGYAADLGCWDNELARSLADVDLLALEFNHDEHLQRTQRSAAIFDRAGARRPRSPFEPASGRLVGENRQRVDAHESAARRTAAFEPGMQPAQFSSGRRK